MKSLKCFALGFALLLAGTGMPAFEAEAVLVQKGYSATI